MIHDMNKMFGDKLPLGKLPLGNILCLRAIKPLI